MTMEELNSGQEEGGSEEEEAAEFLKKLNQPHIPWVASWRVKHGICGTCRDSRHTTDKPWAPLCFSSFFCDHNTTTSFDVSNNWVGPTWLGSWIHNLAMKLSRSGATPGLVSTNGRWKFEPGGASRIAVDGTRPKAL